MGARLSLDAPAKLAVSAMAHITQCTCNITPYNKSPLLTPLLHVVNQEQLRSIQKKLYEAAKDCDRTNINKMKHIVTHDQFVEAMKEAEIESEGMFKAVSSSKQTTQPLPLFVDVEILEKFFTLYDKYGKGEVNAAEYVTALAPLVKGELEDKMKRKWRYSLKELRRYHAGLVSIVAFDVYTFQREQRVSARELMQWMTWAFSAAEYCGDRVPTDEALDALCDAVLEDIGEGDEIEFAQAREVIAKSRTLEDFLEQVINCLVVVETQSWQELNRMYAFRRRRGRLSLERQFEIPVCLPRGRSVRDEEYRLR